uniref:Uncharacterized protein n=1 Tax=Cacopsylla melanoneura TaxID=428564 RepID=A0A8D8Q0U0_9HEMI
MSEVQLTLIPTYREIQTNPTALVYFVHEISNPLIVCFKEITFTVVCRDVFLNFLLNSFKSWKKTILAERFCAIWDSTRFHFFLFVKNWWKQILQIILFLMLQSGIFIQVVVNN